MQVSGKHDHTTPLPPAGGAGGGLEISHNPCARGPFKPRNTQRARELRNQATPAERQLWTVLSNRKMAGHKFSRQMPVGPYFADFLCREVKLVVELDGYSHEFSQKADNRRDLYMVENGYTVLRIANEDVMANLEGCVQLIAASLADIGPPPTPPAGGRGDDAAPVGEGLK